MIHLSLAYEASNSGCSVIQVKRDPRRTISFNKATSQSYRTAGNKYGLRQNDHADFRPARQQTKPTNKQQAEA